MAGGADFGEHIGHPTGSRIEENSMKKLDDYSDESLTDLRDELKRLKKSVETAIKNRKAQIQSNSSLDDNQRRMLNDFIPAAEEAINYISDSANSLFDLFESLQIHVFESQKIHATAEAIQAYELILRISNNPNTPINEKEIAILQGLDRHKLYSSISVPLAILTFALLIVSALIFMSLQAIAITSFTLSMAIPIVAAAFVISAIASYVNTDAYSQDKNLHKNLTTSLPTFFGKKPPKENEKNDDVDASSDLELT